VARHDRALEGHAAVDVVIATPHFPPFHTGGTEWESCQKAMELLRRGHAVRVVSVETVRDSPHPAVSAVDDTYQGVAVHRLSLARVERGVDRAEYDNAALAGYLETWLAARRPDVFHLFSGYLLTARTLDVARRLGSATVLTLMDYWWLCPRITMVRSDGRLSDLPIDPATCAQCLAEERRRYRLPARVFPRAARWWWRHRPSRSSPLEERLAYHRAALRQVDLVISRSAFLGNTIMASLGPRPIVVQPQGVDVPQEPPLKTAAPRLRLGYLGQIAPHKGLHVLIDALRLLADAAVELTIHGDLDRFPEYAARVRQQAGADARVTFAGHFVDRRSLAERFARLDVVVVPSLYYENLPNVILEAFAHGTPIIASNLGGMREAVRHEVDGLLFETGNAADLAAQIRRLIEDSALVARLHGGITRPASVSDEVDVLIEAYETILTKRMGTRALVAGSQPAACLPPSPEP
jgi:glycosyltransferase involved in cell wall biosynthesis